MVFLASPIPICICRAASVPTEGIDQLGSELLDDFALDFPDAESAASIILDPDIAPHTLNVYRAGTIIH